MKTIKLFKRSGNTPRDPDTARTHPTFITRCVARNSHEDLRVLPRNQKVSSWRRIPAQQNRSSECQTDGSGDRKGANLMATAKSCASSFLTHLLGPEGRVRTNRLFVRHHEIQSHDNFSNQGTPNRIYSTRGSRIVLAGLSRKGLPGRPGKTKNYACNSYLQPSRVITSILQST